jgi:formylmethanofuran dehydrogenase subunit E-like metal-binding protein
MKRVPVWVILLAATVFLAGASCVSTRITDSPKTPEAPEMGLAEKSVVAALRSLGAEKGDRNVLALTNAGYAIIGGQSSEAFLDILSQETGCSPGRRSLLTVHTPFTEPLWYALYKRDKGRMVYGQWSERQFQEQAFDGSPHAILKPDAWKKAASGIAGGGKTLFSIVSISHCWAAGGSWQTLKSCEFHNHFCPGVETGFVISDYLRSQLPLKPGESYSFIAAPSGCAVDVLQVLYDTTTGKTAAYAKTISQEKIKQYAGSLWYEAATLIPLPVIASRINEKEDTCEGVVLGMDYKRLFEDTASNAPDFDPPGGRSNPIRYIVRVKLASKMLAMSDAEKRKYLVEVKKFKGPASLAQKLAQEGTDPYAVIWSLG